MGSVCSRRSERIHGTSTPLLPAAVLSQIRAYHSLPASTLRIHRRWRLAIRKVIKLIRLRLIWASLGRHLRASRSSILFAHLERGNAALRNTTSTQREGQWLFLSLQPFIQKALRQDWRWRSSLWILSLCCWSWSSPFWCSCSTSKQEEWTKKRY